MGKGSGRRPCLTGREENDLRDDLYRGKISEARFNREYDLLLIQGKITRSGRVVKNAS